MAVKITNFAETTLLQSVTAAATTVYLADDTAFPQLSPGDSYKLTVYDGVNPPEIMNVTAETAGVLTVTRAQEGTAAYAWPAGTKAVCGITAAQLEAILNLDSSADYYGTATATGTNTWTITLDTVPSLVNIVHMTFLTPGENTGAVTIRLSDGVTPGSYKSLRRPDGTLFEAGDLPAGWLVHVEWSVVDDFWRLTYDTGLQLRATAINDAPYAVNFARNAEFRQWSAASFSTPANNSEVQQDWYVRYDGSIGTFTVSRQAFTLGQTDVPGEPKYFARWDHTSAGSGSTFRNWEWADEQDVRWGAGEDATFSIYAKADNPITVTAEAVQNFGTGGSPSAEVIALTESWNLTTSWQRFDLSGTLPSITGKTIGSNDDSSIRFRLKLPVNVTMRVDIAAFQPELGERATRFNGRRPLVEDALGLSNLVPPPAADRVAIYDYSALSVAWADLGTGLAITGTTLGLSSALQDVHTAALTAAELSQLGNINSVAITNAQWAAVGSISTFVATVLNDVDAATFLTTIGAQPLDSDLTALASNSTNGLWARTGAGTGSARTITGSTHLAVSNGDGVSGNPTLTVNTGTSGGSIPLLNGVNTWASAQTFSSSVTVSGGSTVGGSVTLTAGGANGTLEGLIFQNTNAGTIKQHWEIMNSGSVRVVNSGYSVALFEFTQTGDLRFTGAPTALDGLSAGFRGAPVDTKNSSYTFALADSGKTIHHDNGSAYNWTIPTNASIAFPVGTVIVLSNTGSAAITLVRAGGVTLYKYNGAAPSSADQTLAAYSSGSIHKIATDTWIARGVS